MKLYSIDTGFFKFDDHVTRAASLGHLDGCKTSGFLEHHLPIAQYSDRCSVHPSGTSRRLRCAAKGPAHRLHERIMPSLCALTCHWILQ